MNLNFARALLCALFVVVSGMSVIATAQTSSTNSVPFPTGITYDGTYLYLSHGAGYREMYRLDPATGAITGDVIPLGGEPRDLVYDGAGHFYASDLSGSVREIDTAGNLVKTFPLPFRGGAIAFDGTNLYIGDTDSRTILVTDSAGNVIRSFDSGLRAEGMVFDPTTGNLRVITLFDSKIYEISTTGQFIRSCNSPFTPGPYGLGGITLVGSKFVVAEALIANDPLLGTAILVIDRAGLVCQPTTCSDSAPRIVNAAPSTNTLWPPNHEMVAVAINYDVQDDCDAATSSLSVASNEPAGRSGDWIVIDSHHVELRAERAGSGNGRIYNVTITAVDASNHLATHVVTVSVPHDQAP